MVNPWLGMGLVLACFGALTSGLRAYRRWHGADPELSRKLLHAGMGLLTLTFPWLFGPSWPVVLLATVFVVGLSALGISPFLRRHFGGVIDEVGRQSMGELCFPLAVGLLYLLSAGDPLTFCIPMLILSLADPAAALIGQRYGTLRYPTGGETKSLEGSVAFFVVALLSTQVPLRCFTNASRGETWLISLTVGLLLSLVEAMAVRGLDNLGIPLAAFLLLRRFPTLSVPALAARFAVAIVLAVLVELQIMIRIPKKPGRVEGIVGLRPRDTQNPVRHAPDEHPTLLPPPDRPYGWFETHIREAIALNKRRLPLYAALSAGRSRKISWLFILNQYLVLPITRYVDRRAERYQRAGIPIVCMDMVSMSLAPAFRDRSPVSPQPLRMFRPPNAGGIRRMVRRAYAAGGFPAVSRSIGRELERLEAVPTYHCMVRHMLESAWRCSNLAPIYVQQARRLGVESPAGLSWLLIRLHLVALTGCGVLDRLAAPLQARGILILAQDVPPIDAFPGRPAGCSAHEHRRASSAEAGQGKEASA